MKRKIIKWVLRILAVAILMLGVIVCVVLNPTLLYSNKTVIGKFTVYHNQPIDEYVKVRLLAADELLKTSEFYSPNLQFDICLNDGSLYPSFMQLFLGRAFALGFTSNKIAICGNTNFRDNYVEVNNRKWNLTQLLAHEATHCLVFHKIGFWKSNPVASNPNWKWEGYPEYVSRKDSDEIVLVKNIELLNDTTDKNDWGIELADSTLAPREYFRYRTLIQYCIEIKKMSFENLLNDTTSEQTITTQLMNWFEKKKS